MTKAKQSLLLLSAAWMAAVLGTGQAESGPEPAKAPNPAQMRALSLKKTDLNGDGFVSREEFAEANHLRTAEPASDRDIRAARLVAAFQAMDGNGDGRVSAKEYLSYLEKNGG